MALAIRVPLLDGFIIIIKGVEVRCRVVEARTGYVRLLFSGDKETSTIKRIKKEEFNEYELMPKRFFKEGF